MSDFVNTIDALGDDAVIDSIIHGTITEFKDNVLTSLGSGALTNCAHLTTVDLPSLTECKGHPFTGCVELKSVNLPELQSVINYMFYRCLAIESLVLPKVLDCGQNCFASCNALVSLDFTAMETIKSNSGINSANKLSTLILRSHNVVTLEKAIFHASSPIQSGTGYIYVPRALVDSYKAATNWSTYAEQFRALEDYTVDGTITGELDETKI